MRIGILMLCAILAMSLISSHVFANNRIDDPADVAVSPHTLILSENQCVITVHTAIPYRLVDCDTLSLSGVSATATKADDCGDLVAKFDESEVKALVSPPESTLTLTGYLVTGEFLSCSDTVQVKP